tara:strand:- start:9406 stop:10326 length:921 start_codon:yes stop_codon:yes gene_type:complete
LAPRFAEYGIPVPLKHDRSNKIFSALKKQFPKLTQTNPNDLPEISFDDLRLVHDLDFIARLFDASLVAHEVESCYEFQELLPATKNINEMPADVITQCRGTYAAIKKAIKNDCSFFLGGGMHHAMSFAGRGFCLLNDIVIGARKAQHELGVSRVLIIDVDAHKGDGTAQILQSDDSIFTLSIHMKNGWPLDGSLGPGPWQLPSDLDIELLAGQESQYLEQLKMGLDQALKNQFDLAIIVLGADAWEKDELPSASGLRLSEKQMLERDQLIEQSLKTLNIPRAYVMGGGYGENAHIPYVNFLTKLID